MLELAEALHAYQHPLYTPSEIAEFCSRGIALYQRFISHGKKPSPGATKHYQRLVVWKREAEKRRLSDARILEIQGEVLKSWEQVQHKCRRYK